MSLQGPDQNSEPTNCIWPTSICAETSRHLYCVDSVKIVYSIFILDSGRFGFQQNVYHDLTLASSSPRSTMLVGQAVSRPLAAIGGEWHL